MSQSERSHQKTKQANITRTQRALRQKSRIALSAGEMCPVRGCGARLYSMENCTTLSGRSHRAREAIEVRLLE